MSYKMLRKQYKLTQSDVANMVGTYQAYVSLFENNKLQNQSLAEFYNELQTKKYQGYLLVLLGILIVAVLGLVYVASI